MMLRSVLGPWSRSFLPPLLFFCPEFQFCMEKGECIQLHPVLPSAKWSFYWPLSSETSS